MKNKYLELEKLKFRYQYLNDTEKQNYTVYTVLFSAIFITGIIKGDDLISKISIVTFVIFMGWIMYQIKKIQQEMKELYYKIINFK